VVSGAGGTAGFGAGGTCIMAGVCDAAESAIAASTLPKYRPETQLRVCPPSQI